MRSGTAFDALLTANEAYATSGRHVHLQAPPRRRLAVLTCMDARIDPLEALGLAVGDAKIFRNAGARATPDAVRSLLVAVAVLGVESVMVLQHTECGVARPGEELAELVRKGSGAELADIGEWALPDPDAALTEDVQRLSNTPGFEQVSVAGFRYDVATGRVHQVVASA